ncbi:MAG: DNA mismatch endonuclease Vsr [Prolixibacteraceae bacterium]|jgi:DNA mismatch endonuclease (patch repair protein)|nr:DNA mismatch endonuclease Vsr [Prolixibacteraceae bacterium]
MADVHDKRTRSYNMSQIKSKDTKPEILVRKFLFSKGFRYRLHDKKLPGKPDIVLQKYKTIIFIHGCFWHGHNNCKYFVVPKTRTEWWLKKIERNKQLDCDNFQVLQKLGWKVLTIFECELKKKNIYITLNELTNKIH